MKDIKAYIESGILELYVIGDLNEEQIREVEQFAAQYPEIRQEIDAIEMSMENYAYQHAIIPKTALKEELFQTLKLNPSGNEDAAKVLPLYPRVTAGPKVRNLQIALAACVALLVMSIIALYSAHHKLDNAQNQIATLSLQNEKYTNAVNFMKQTNEEMQKILDMGDDPNWAKVQLAGVQQSPSARMTVYWNKTNQHVMLVNSKMDLPAHDKNHQYQLWAIVDGKPVDLGVFDIKTDSETLLLRMKEVSSAQAFAVTLEKLGGSPAPTMEQMVVMGGVSI